MKIGRSDQLCQRSRLKNDENEKERKRKVTIGFGNMEVLVIWTREVSVKHEDKSQSGVFSRENWG